MAAENRSQAVRLYPEQHMFFKRLLVFVVVLAGMPQLAMSDDSKVTFEEDVLPLLRKHCVKCHNASSRKGELDLSDAAGLFKGGESGQVVVPGKLDDSYLYHVVHDKQMPPEDEDDPLTSEQIHVIESWIKAGSPFADGTDPVSLIEAAEVNQHVIEPIMLLRCTVCHGAGRREADLDLRTKAAMLKGGKSGPAIVLGKPGESLVLKRIHAEEMPPRDKLLPSGVKVITSGELSQLTDWIAKGGPEVDIKPDIATVEEDPLIDQEDREFWAFQSPRRDLIPPVVEHSSVARTGLDLFLLRKLEENGFKFSKEADKESLLRRAFFDLTGLPPTVEDVQAFMADNDPLAYERLVDRLLASPAYGEKWARMWLDAAGYADSEGKRSADPIRRSAWRYRDYVIQAMNSDKPYSQFLLEQIAGDEIVDYSNHDAITDETVSSLVATGFLRMAPDGTGSDVVNSVAERMEVIADEIDIFGSTVMAMTLKCARCHSHKYDPIPHRDYYRLLAIFQGAFDQHDWLKPTAVPGQTNGIMKNRALEVSTPEQRNAVEAHNAAISEQIAAAEKPVKELFEKLKQDHRASVIESLPEQIRVDVDTALKIGDSDRSEIQKYLAEKFTPSIKFDEESAAKDKDYAAVKKKADDEVKSLTAQKRQPPTIRALWDRGRPSPTYIYIRGDHRQSGRLVGPGVPSVLTDGKTPFEPAEVANGSEGTGRRLALANWLIEPNHPLTARVIVNRIWHHHFGRGIVASIDNFGELGSRPTHPELLDYLATRFVDSGWSIKELHREIMTSTAYRQSSVVTDEQLSDDPENKWVGRMQLRRLTAEEVRDSIIAVSEMFEQSQFGTPDEVNVRGDGLVTAIAKDGAYRRSIYLRQRRKEMPSFLETFDLPQMNPACQDRAVSTVAQQALYLLNSSMVRELAESFAIQVRKHVEDRDGQIDRVFLATAARLPSVDEKEVANQSLTELEQLWRDHATTLSESEQAKFDAELKALATYCHTLLNSASFLYVD